MKETWEFLKFIPTKQIKVKKKRKLWKTAAIHTNITFTHSFSQHVQISCLKNQHAKNQIVYLIASFTIPLRKEKVKVSYAKISRIFLHNNNASTEPRNYLINLVFLLNKNLIYFSCVTFLILATIFHKIWDFEKKMKKKKKKKMQKRHSFLNGTVWVKKILYQYINVFALLWALHPEKHFICHYIALQM